MKKLYLLLVVGFLLAQCNTYENLERLSKNEEVTYYDMEEILLVPDSQYVSAAYYSATQELMYLSFAERFDDTISVFVNKRKVLEKYYRSGSITNEDFIRKKMTRDDLSIKFTLKRNRGKQDILVYQKKLNHSQVINIDARRGNYAYIQYYNGIWNVTYYKVIVKNKDK